MRVLYPISRRSFTPVRYWAVPIAYTILALTLGFLVPRIDDRLIEAEFVAISVVSETAILSSIASGMMALTGITFSLVFVVVQFGSSAYSPRLVAMLARSRIIRHSAGLFVGTFLFALIALASLDRQNRTTAPTLTTVVAFVWMLGSIVAIRALSPAVNDPTTAVMALDQIEDLLRRLGRSDLNVGHEVDRHGALRLVYPTPCWEDFLELALIEIMYYGAHSIQVMRRMAVLLRDLELAVPPSRQATVRHFGQRLHLSVEHSFDEPEYRRDAEELDRQGLGLARHEPSASHAPFEDED